MKWKLVGIEVDVTSNHHHLICTKLKKEART